MNKEWNVRIVANVQYYQDFIVEAKTKEDAESQLQKNIDNETLDYENDVKSWNEYHEGDNVNYWINSDYTEDMESV